MVLKCIKNILFVRNLCLASSTRNGRIFFQKFKKKVNKVRIHQSLHPTSIDHVGIELDLSMFLVQRFGRIRAEK